MIKLLLLYFPITLLMGQTPYIDSLNVLLSKFEYENVANYSDEILRSVELKEEEKIEVLLINGIANFSLSKEQETREVFIDILNINPNYIIDPIKVSPKIISLFNIVKNEFNRIIIRNTVEPTIIRDTLLIELPPKIIKEQTENYSLVKSFVIPGWGHFEKDAGIKSILITSLSSVLLVASVYSIIETADKEEGYLNESEEELIQLKYIEYNDAYKRRNIFLTGFGMVWLFAQIDLLFFETNDKKLNLSIGGNFSEIIEIKANLSF